MVVTNTKILILINPIVLILCNLIFCQGNIFTFGAGASVKEKWSGRLKWSSFSWETSLSVQRVSKRASRSDNKLSWPARLWATGATRRESQQTQGDLLRTNARTNTPITVIIPRHTIFFLLLNTPALPAASGTASCLAAQKDGHASKFTAAINKQVDNWEGKKSGAAIALGHANVLARH